MSQDINFYTLLDQMTYNETLDFLVHNQTEITLKINERHFKSKILNRNKSNQFLIYKFNFESYSLDPAVCSFEISAEKYFFKSNISSETAALVLTIPTEVFKLQRRNDFRIAVPETIPYVCEIKSIRNSTLNLKSEIRDLSLGGCQLSVKLIGTNLHRGDNLYLKIKIHSFEWDKIHCQCKHSSSKKNDLKSNVGLKFHESSAAFVTDLQALLVQLDRIHRGKTYD